MYAIRSYYGFDNYVGVVMLVRVVDGVLKPKDKVRLMASGGTYLCEQVGVFTPKAVQRDCLAAGEVGRITSYNVCYTKLLRWMTSSKV